MASGMSDPRPLSPHLGVWRWHITMATSILHRASGFANAFGMILLVYWLGSIAAGPGAYAAAEGLLLSWFGRVVLFGFTLSISFHLVNGVRYLFWDSGVGLSPKTASATSWLNLVLALVLTALIWAGAYAL